MRITYERSGGFAGLMQTVTVDTDDLSKEQAVELLELVEDARLFDKPEAATESLEPESILPDRMSCSVTVEVEGYTHTVDFNDHSVPEEAEPLLRQLSLMARQPNTPEDNQTDN